MALPLKSDILMPSSQTRHLPHADAWRSRQRYISRGRRSNFKTPQDRVQPSFLISHLIVHAHLSDDGTPTMTLPCADRVVLYTATMARGPEPLERVRALVCEPCWVNCFDTEGFEKLGRGEIDEHEYKVSVACGHHAMTCMIHSVGGLRLRRSLRKPDVYNVS